MSGIAGLTIQVRIAWDADATVVPETSDWFDLPDLRAISIRMGRQHELARPEAGVATILAGNRERIFEPGFAGSPLYPNILPMRRVNIRAHIYGVTYDLFTGYIESITPSYTRRDGTVSIVAVDAFKVFQYIIGSATYAQESTGTRIGNVLDDIGWPAADRDIDTGDTIIVGETFANASVMGHFLDVQQSEMGRLYMAGNGAVTFRGRNAEILNQDIQTYLGGDGGLPYYEEPVWSFEDTQIWNRVTVQNRVTGYDFTATANNTESQTKYFTRTLVLDTLAYRQVDCQSEAQFMVTAYAEPQLRVGTVRLRPQASTYLWPHVLGRVIGARIDLTRRPLLDDFRSMPILMQAVIEGITHEWHPGLWETGWELAPASQARSWIIGDPIYGVVGVTTIPGW